MFEHFSHPLPPLPPLQTALGEVKGYHSACWRYINPLTKVCDSVCVCACGRVCVHVCVHMPTDLSGELPSKAMSSKWRSAGLNHSV